MAVAFNDVKLVNCIFLPQNEPPEELRYHVGVKQFKRFVEVDSDGHPHMSFIVDFNILAGVQKEWGIFSVCFCAIYSADNRDDFDVIKDHVALAHLIPFLREFVANLTMRSLFPKLVLPPVNTADLMKDYGEREGKKEK